MRFMSGSPSADPAGESLEGISITMGIFTLVLWAVMAGLRE